MRPDASGSSKLARSRVGRKAQAGGAVALLIGVLLLFFGPSQAPGSTLNPHQLDWLFIGFGVFLVAAGTVGRWLLLD